MPGLQRELEICLRGIEVARVMRTATDVAAEKLFEVFSVAALFPEPNFGTEDLAELFRSY